MPDGQENIVTGNCFIINITDPESLGRPARPSRVPDNRPAGGPSIPDVIPQPVVVRRPDGRVVLLTPGEARQLGLPDTGSDSPLPIPRRPGFPTLVDPRLLRQMRRTSPLQAELVRRGLARPGMSEDPAFAGSWVISRSNLTGSEISRRSKHQNSRQW